MFSRDRSLERRNYIPMLHPGIAAAVVAATDVGPVIVLKPVAHALRACRIETRLD